MFSKRLAFLATTALVGNAFVVATASAQSTGTLASEEASNVIIVTGSRGADEAGVAIAQTVDKTRSTIDQTAIQKQNPGQTILQSLNIVPGINFTNADPYGNSGGNIRLRGFDGNRVGLAFDGVPLNDSGNYATFTNQLLDPELITQASVNQGTTDVDSPTAAAIGGIINYVSSNPYDDLGATANASFGDFNYNRYFLRGDTGEIGPWGTKAYVAGSYTQYEKFKGAGTLQKSQFNAKLYQNLGDTNFVALSFHYNQNRNSFYNTFVNLVQFANGEEQPNGYFENDSACLRPTAVNGTVQNDQTNSTLTRSDGTVFVGTNAVPQSCTNYAGIRINPSDTGNVRVNFSYALTDNLRLTLDPSFQYVMANGGNYTTISERIDRLDLNTANNAALTAGTSCLANAAVYQTGVDLNGDNDSCDTVALYAPSNTNTRRYGVLGSLIFDLSDTQRFRASYSTDYARHRQTGEGIKVGQNGDTENVFGGKDGWGDESLRAVGVGGTFYRTRDRYSVAILNQLSLDYHGEFFDDMLTVSAGVRQPIFERELNQYCWTSSGTSTVVCTPQTATLIAGGNGNYLLGGDAGAATQYVEPFATKFKYDKVLPNITVGGHLGDNTVYGSYSEQIAVPRTDNLYTVSRPTAVTAQPIAYNNVAPEFSKNYELGYRYTTGSVVASAAVFLNEYSNRVVSTLDNDPSSPTFQTTIDRNVGKVESKGFEGSVGWQILDNLSLYGAYTYLDAQLQEDQVLGLTTVLPTKGKKVVETPENMFSMRGDWEIIPGLSVGLQGKYVSERFTTDVNDEVVPSYTVFDFDARYELGSLLNVESAFVQLNVSNFTDERYPVQISSGTNAIAIADVDPGPGVVVRNGAPRTFGISAPMVTMVTLGTRF